MNVQPTLTTVINMPLAPILLVLLLVLVTEDMKVMENHVAVSYSNRLILSISERWLLVGVSFCLHRVYKLELFFFFFFPSKQFLYQLNAAHQHTTNLTRATDTGVVMTVVCTAIDIQLPVVSGTASPGQPE